jgi:eukaryotic-like serine/threonine-protein kinase
MVCPNCRSPNADDARFCGSCGFTLGGSGGAPRQPTPMPMQATGAASPAALDGLIGRTVGGRYRVVSKLGQGGMGTVFRAEQISVKRLIALKVLDPTLGTDPELIRRFNAEAEVAGRLSHPNTVTLFDFGQDETGLLFIAMELVKGTSVRDVIQNEGAVAPLRAVDIAEQVASSLADAHAHGIVHRDLKPDNVILSERAGRQDVARVLDFGIAKLRDDRGTLTGANAAMTRAGQLLGTPAYMSPEQILGQGIDGRTDVYALGVMLYEMVSGRLPFDATSLMALLAMHMHDAPIPLEIRRPDLMLPIPLKTLIMRCLAKAPADRPADMKAVLLELGEMKQSLGGGRAATGAMPGYTPPPSGPPPFAPPYTPAPTAWPPQVHAPTAQPTPPPNWAPPAASATPPPSPAALASSPWVPPPPPGTTPTPPPKRKPNKAIWIAALVGALAVAIAVPLALRKKGDEAVTTPEPTPSPPTPTDPEPTPPGPGPGPSDPDPPPSETTTYHQPDVGYTIKIPSGLIGSEQQNGGYMAGGLKNGRTFGIVVAQITGVGDMISTINSSGGTVTDEATRYIDDEGHASYTFEQGPMRCEAVIYQGGKGLLAVMYCVQPLDQFIETTAERDQLFRFDFDPGRGG